MIRSTTARIVAVGILAGMRSMSAPVFAGAYAARGRALNGSRWSLLASPTTSTALKALAASELIADKLPIPARVSTGPLLVRIASGAISGALISAADEERPGRGALLGGLAAIAGTFGFYHLRRKLGRDTDVPDRLLGLAEDGLVLGIGRTALGPPR